MGFLSFIAVTSQISQNKSLSSLTIHTEQAGSRDTDGIVFIDVRPALVLPSPAHEVCREAEAAKGGKREDGVVPRHLFVMRTFKTLWTACSSSPSQPDYKCIPTGYKCMPSPDISTSPGR